MAKESIPAVAAEVKTAFISNTSVRFAGKAGLVAGLGLLLANCASQPQQTGYSAQQSREFGAFAAKKYGTASPRLYADTGASLPKGGGRDHIGKAYQVAGRRYVPHDRPVGSTQTGMASWYGAAFHGRKTANGEIYDRRSFSAAHPTMPLPSYARVTNLRNGYSVIVRVNDRGPYHGGRIMDVSERVADTLAFKASGTGRIKVDYLGRAGLGGSDDVRLAQTLTMDGRPAVAAYIPASYGENRGVQVASAAPVEAVASAPPAQAATFTPAPRPAAVPAVMQARTAEPAEAPAKDTAATAAPQGRSPAMSAAIEAAKGESKANVVPVRAPVPPSRPIDLGTIPGAGSPVKAEKSASLSFAPRATGLSKLQQGSPLAQLPPARFAPKKISALAAKD